MSDRVTIAVTGVNGFVGRHLVNELTSHGISVIGLGYEQAADPAINDLLAGYTSVDLTTRWPAIGHIDAVIHLAGLAAVGPSFAEPQRYIETNSAMVTHLGESLLGSSDAPRIVIASSGAVYSPFQSMPLAEESALAYGSPYSVSKILVESQAAYYRSRGLDCVVARPFNHIGPGQGPGFLLPDLFAGLRASNETAEALMVGNLATSRDYTDVRDVCRAYRFLASADSLTHATYNISSGTSVNGEVILATLRDVSGLLDVPVEVDPGRIRPNDPAAISGDNARIVHDTGWLPAITLRDSIADFVATPMLPPW